jgi:hypothetical protein
VVQGTVLASARSGMRASLAEPRRRGRPSSPAADAARGRGTWAVAAREPRVTAVTRCRSDG